MLIVLEGCDGVGKSTIAERIRQVASLSGDAEVLHKGPIEFDAITEYEDPLETYAPGSGRHIICDRWHVGELIYGPLLRGQSRMSEWERRHIDMFLAARGALIIHVLTPENETRRRLSDRGDDLVKSEQVGLIVDTYHEVFATYGWTCVMMNAIMTSREDQNRDTIRFIIETAARLEARAVPLPQFKTYVGSPAPAILLLGERRNPDARSENRRAAFVPGSATSGSYLLQALPKDIEQECGMANACEEDIVSLFELLGYPLVVALGREAERECEHAELDYGVVPHPQYVRRFHYDMLLDYGRAIREAAHHRRDMTHAFSHPGT